jgi:hypothetical protein
MLQQQQHRPLEHQQQQQQQRCVKFVEDLCDMCVPYRDSLKSV